MSQFKDPTRGLSVMGDVVGVSSDVDTLWSNVVLLARTGDTISFDQKGRNEVFTTGASVSSAQTFGGRVEYSMQYASSGDRTEMSDSTDFTIGAGDYSVECLVRFSSLPSAGNSVVLVSHAAVTSNDFGWVFDLLNDGGVYKLRFRSTTDGTDASASARDVAATWTTPSTDTDYYVAFTRSSGVVNLYAGPTSASTAPRLGTGLTTGTIFDSSANLVIAARPTGAQNLSGFVGGVRCTNVARTSDTFISIPSAFWPITGS